LRTRIAHSGKVYALELVVREIKNLRKGLITEKLNIKSRKTDSDACRKCPPIRPPGPHRRNEHASIMPQSEFM
jgi:hypothetical protein